MWVVKIGGSLGHEPALRQWLRELCEGGGGRIGMRRLVGRGLRFIRHLVVRHAKRLLEIEAKRASTGR